LSVFTRRGERWLTTWLEAPPVREPPDAEEVRQERAAREDLARRLLARGFLARSTALIADLPVSLVEALAARRRRRGKV
jgi:hypothetical protein